MKGNKKGHPHPPMMFLCAFVLGAVSWGFMVQIINELSLYTPSSMSISKTGDEVTSSTDNELSLYTPSSMSISKSKTGDEVTSSTESDSVSDDQDKQLVDFAIVGFAKCGTGSIMKFLNIPNKTYMGYTKPKREKREQCIKSDVELLNKYGPYSKDSSLKTAFKCPSALGGGANNDVIKTYLRNVEHPKLIVSVRHPVTQFQSAYDFFNRREKGPLPDPFDKLGPSGEFCIQSIPKIDDHDGHNKENCKSQASALSTLHLTPLTDDDEWDLLDHHHRFELIPDFNGTLFLIESGQLLHLSNGNSDKGINMRNALEQFTGLELGTLRDKPFPLKDSYPKLMNICDKKYEPLRKILTERGERSGRWLREYLLKSDKVIVPNRQDFIELVKLWSLDPCTEHRHL